MAVPNTVVDQIVLWERERNRLKISLAALYLDFKSETQFTRTLDAAAADILWSNSKEKAGTRRLLCVKLESKERVTSFLKSLNN